jgi:hypothetical protein
MDKRLLSAATMMVFLFLGCGHSRLLERQCHQLRNGMPFAVAYKTITAATPVCSYHTAKIGDENVPECILRRTDVPAYVIWAVPVFGSAKPDGCRIDLYGGRVVDIAYWIGNVPE